MEYLCRRTNHRLTAKIFPLEGSEYLNSLLIVPKDAMIFVETGSSDRFEYVCMILAVSGLRRYQGVCVSTTPALKTISLPQ